MTARYRLIFFVTVGLGAILVATRLGSLSALWRSLFIFSGGWLMAIGLLYQVQLYADRKDAQYYTLLAFTVVFWLSMIVISVFQLGLVTGLFHHKPG